MNDKTKSLLSKGGAASKEEESLKNENSPWYEKQYIVNIDIVNIALVLFFPVGLYALWQSSKFQVKTKKIITVAVAVVVVWLIIGSFTKESANQNKTVSSQQQETLTSQTFKEEPRKGLPTRITFQECSEQCNETHNILEKGISANELRKRINLNRECTDNCPSNY